MTFGPFADIALVFGGLALLISAYHLTEWLHARSVSRRTRQRIASVLKGRDLL